MFHHRPVICLWYYTEKSIKNVGTDISFLICRDLPASHKDWYTMLQNQRQTHNLEVKR